MKQFALLAIFCTLGAQALPDRTPYIINGHQVPHQPYNAYVLYLNAANAGFFGGGSIISDRHIITAAQNIQGYVTWNIGLGSNVFTSLSMLTTTTATPHPSYNANTRANDIGIITLVSSLVFTSTIAPISLPALTETTQLPLENEEGSIVGFGFTTATTISRSDFLIRSYQRVTTISRCQQFYQITVPNHFCGEDNVELSNICNGDIGAGFVTIVRGNAMLTGIASLMTASCANASPSGYTRIVPYRQWIQQITSV
ncbi:collagenase-like [Wyeomyia smithii]|uniref:collagenase-like n=1 Tax=Wyeomyia smithii TaxID=174621 RepID=UPI002467EB5B|nr:collagenase-like [Wyeomyia smithii]XP_055529544.1 collagenase-like [Wyeomyia smithii]XP_055529545.1 collagenase-like [Wyeomyia smithii]